MRPLSGWVLAVAAVLTSPALWAGLVDGTMPLDVTLTRYLLACAGSWVVLSLAADLIWPTGPVSNVHQDASTAESTEPAGGAGH